MKVKGFVCLLLFVLFIAPVMDDVLSSEPLLREIQQKDRAEKESSRPTVKWLPGPFYTPRQYGVTVQLERNDIELGLRSDGVVVWRERGWYSYPYRIELGQPKRAGSP